MFYKSIGLKSSTLKLKVRAFLKIGKKWVELGHRKRETFAQNDIVCLKTVDLSICFAYN